MSPGNKSKTIHLPLSLGTEKRIYNSCKSFLTSWRSFKRDCLPVWSKEHCSGLCPSWRGHMALRLQPWHFPTFPVFLSHLFSQHSLHWIIIPLHLHVKPVTPVPWNFVITIPNPSAKRSWVFRSSSPSGYTNLWWLTLSLGPDTGGNSRGVP